MLWSFGDFKLDSDIFQLSQGHSRIAIERKPLLVLQYLIEHADRVVSIPELIRAVWQGANVTSGSVRRAIALVRKALNDREHTTIASAPGYGYRFVAELRECSGKHTVSEETLRTPP